LSLNLGRTRGLKERAPKVLKTLEALFGVSPYFSGVLDEVI
jgi:hypothetical protein